MKNPLIAIRCNGEIPYDVKKKKREREEANTIFNEVRQFAYVLGVRERELY